MFVQVTRLIKSTAVAALLSCGVIACGEEQRNALFPPEGYYDPILEIETKSGKTDYHGKVVNKFAGRYSISLAFERPTSVAQGYDFDEIEVSCAFSIEGSSAEFPCGKSLLHYWGERSGMSIALYSVPDDVPKNIPVELHVVFRSEEILGKLMEEHGQVRIVVQKWSDL